MKFFVATVLLSMVASLAQAGSLANLKVGKSSEELVRSQGIYANNNKGYDLFLQGKSSNATYVITVNNYADASALDKDLSDGALVNCDMGLTLAGHQDCKIISVSKR